MTTPTQDQLDIKEWSFSPDDRQRRKERIQQRLQHRSTTKTNTATKSTSCFCCLKKSIKKTTQTTPSKSPIQNRKIWELEREYHYNRPSSLHYLYDAFDSTGDKNYTKLELFHLATAIRSYLQTERKNSYKLNLNNKKMQSEITTEVTDLVVKDLDTDQNGYLEYIELNVWLRSNSKTSLNQDTQKQDSNSTVLQFENDFRQDVIDLNTILMERAFREMYTNYDTDGSNSVDSFELLAWMINVFNDTGGSIACTQIPTPEIADRTIRVLDRDDSGTIEIDELLEWLREGQAILLDDAKKKSFLKNAGSSMAETILDFLDMVVLQAAQLTNKYVSDIKTNYLTENQKDIHGAFLQEHRTKRLNERLEKRKSL